uniref:Uncharacterized protein n=1 Tax=Nelumbo nucifera TaxID=4432 RepID=A0A822YCM5_NELNU|nr:TPA_asm: hypothetical protein HUJ06_030739 [Nelumbo nucifera]
MGLSGLCSGKCLSDTANSPFSSTLPITCTSST